MDECRKSSQKPGIDRKLTRFLENFAALQQAIENTGLNVPGLGKLVSDATAWNLRRSCKAVPAKTFGARSPARAAEMLQQLSHPDDQKFVLHRLATVAMSLVATGLVGCIVKDLF